MFQDLRYALGAHRRPDFSEKEKKEQEGASDGNCAITMPKYHTACLYIIV